MVSGYFTVVNLGGFRIFISSYQDHKALKQINFINVGPFIDVFK